MITIEAHGDVISDDDEDAPMYDFFGMPRISERAIREQLATDPSDDVTVNLSSDGGDVFTASAIYSMLRPRNVTVNVTGLAASAGSVIAMAGKTVNISPVGALMIHRAQTITQGNTDDMSQSAEMLNQVDQTIVPAYVAKTGMDEDKLLDLMVKETWITAKQAVDWGFADAIMFDDQPDAKFVASISQHTIPTAAHDRLAGMYKKLTASAKPESTAPIIEPLEPQAKEPSPKPEHTKPTLRDRKLAILLGKMPQEDL